jgi:hypothetical protein
MSGQQRFAIRREDGAWYAGQSADGVPVWEKDLQRAHTFEGYVDAMEAVTKLQQAGHQVRLFGVD